eukprot:351494-Chlamydomonas_euryale.AAC.1
MGGRVHKLNTSLTRRAAQCPDRTTVLEFHRRDACIRQRRGQAGHPCYRSTSAMQPSSSAMARLPPGAPPPSLPASTDSAFIGTDSWLRRHGAYSPSGPGTGRAPPAPSVGLRAAAAAVAATAAPGPFPGPPAVAENAATVAASHMCSAPSSAPASATPHASSAAQRSGAPPASARASREPPMRTSNRDSPPSAAATTT